MVFILANLISLIDVIQNTVLIWNYLTFLMSYFSLTASRRQSYHRICRLWQSRCGWNQTSEIDGEEVGGEGQHKKRQKSVVNILARYVRYLGSRDRNSPVFKKTSTNQTLFRRTRLISHLFFKSRAVNVLFYPHSNITVCFIDLGKLNLLIFSLSWSKSVKQTVKTFLHSSTDVRVNNPWQSCDSL